MQSQASQSHLAQLLRTLRLEAGLTVYKLAQRSGLDRSTVLRCEAGTITQPRREIVHALARALDAEPELLYDAMWQDSPQPLPTPATYFRQKYRLSSEQIQELEASLRPYERGSSEQLNAKGGHHDTDN